MPKTETAELKFGVADLADKLGVDSATARIKLRNAGIAKDKNTGRYGWESKSAMEDVVGKLKAPKAAAKSDTKSKTDTAKAGDKGKGAAKGKGAEKTSEKAGKAKAK